MWITYFYYEIIHTTAGISYQAKPYMCFIPMPVHVTYPPNQCPILTNYTIPLINP